MPIATLAEVKAALGLAGDAEDARLGALIAGAEAAIARHAGRAFAVGAVTERLPGGGATLILGALPVVSVTSVEDLALGETIPPSGYDLDGARGLLRRLPFGAIWGGVAAAGPFADPLALSPQAMQPRWRVVYQAGHAAAPEDVRLALYETVAAFRAGAGGFASEKDGDYSYSRAGEPGLPPSALRLLAPWTSRL